jgi:aconitate hydratase
MTSESRQALEQRLAELSDEIRHYPTPIARCDEQLLDLLERRSQVLAELKRSKTAGLAAAPKRQSGLTTGGSMPHNLHNTLQTAARRKFYSLPRLGKALGVKVARLPISIRVVLESVLRNCDGKKVTEEHVRQLAQWKPDATRTDEIPFVVARIVLQDFTGVPLLCDLAAMRGVADKMGLNPKVIEPLVPVDLVVDHSVQVDHYGSKNALDLNMKLEFKRNEERYQFMKWGMQAFDTFRVVPPGIGIVHQVNLEYLARGVHKKDGLYYPDTLVGTDSHTTMINGIGVVGWGVGGIEAEAGMLGQPVYFLTPDVVGVNLKGKLHPRAPRPTWC